MAANREAEKLLKEISESTAVAEKEKHKVALIVEEVSKTAKVGLYIGFSAGALPVLACNNPAIASRKNVKQHTAP